MKNKLKKEFEKVNKKLHEKDMEEFIILLAENKIAIEQLSDIVEKTGKDIDEFLKQQRDFLTTFIIV